MGQKEAEEKQKILKELQYKDDLIAREQEV